MRYFLFLLCLAALPALAQSKKISECLELSKRYAANQPDSAVHYCAIAMQIAENLNDRHSQGTILLELGRINSLHTHAELARKFNNEALSLFRGINDAEGLAQAYDALGMLDGQQKNLAAAARDLDSARQFYRDSHDSSGILDTYNGLATAFEEKGEHEKALTYYLRTLVQYETRKVKPAAYFLLLDRIGHLYMKKGDTRNALKYLEEGVRTSHAAADRDTEVTLLDEEGRLLEQEGHQTLALDRYKQALDEAKKYHLPERQAEALIGIASILKKEDAALSLADLKKALHLADSLRQPKLQASIYAAMSGVYRQQKDYKEAMNALEENRRLLDSLLRADTTTEIAALDSSYTLENSREKISGLQKINKQEKTELDLGLVILIGALVSLVLLFLYLRKVRRLNAELKAANRVKDTLFSVIGHDLKGPAGSAAQLFGMMETGEFSEEELKGMVSELKKQTESSFELLQSLFEWGRAQLQGIRVSPEALDARELIQRNIALLKPQAELKNITVADHTPTGLNILADPHHTDFIIRNLLANAIKFTYELGRIDLEARHDGRNIILSVSDTGKGISADQQAGFNQNNLQVTFGTKGEKGSGLGLLLIKDFVRANKGRIWLESIEGQGTSFYVALPVA